MNLLNDEQITQIAKEHVPNASTSRVIAAIQTAQEELLKMNTGMPSRRLTDKQIRDLHAAQPSGVAHREFEMVARAVEDILFAQTTLPLHSERIGISLLPSQCSLLLDIYQGKINTGAGTPEVQMRFNAQDMRALIKLGLVNFDIAPIVSPKGMARVMEILE